MLPHNAHSARALFKVCSYLAESLFENALHQNTSILLNQLVNLQKLTNRLSSEKQPTLLIRWYLFKCPKFSFLTTVLTNLLASEVSPIDILDPFPIGTVLPTFYPFHTTDDLRNRRHTAVYYFIFGTPNEHHVALAIFYYSLYQFLPNLFCQF